MTGKRVKAKTDELVKVKLWNGKTYLVKLPLTKRETKTETKDEPSFQQELDRVKAELEFEDFLALASEEMEIRELLAQADRRGEVYGVGYDEGFWAGRELQNKYEIARQEAISLKYEALKR